MKFGRSIPLLLFFGLLLPTFIIAESKKCDVGGKCYWNGQFANDLIPGMETKFCDDGMCYAFKCLRADGQIMYGAGCYEDFVNTCGFIQSSIMQNAKRNKKFRYSDESVIAVSCSDEITDLSSCAQLEFNNYVDENIKDVFGSKHNKTENQLKPCDNDDKFISPFKPQVQCLKGGQCLTGRIKSLPPFDFSYVTCNACAGFYCNVNERATAEMQKIKARKKLYNYIDENNMVSSCAYGEYCSVLLFESFGATVEDKKIGRIGAPILASKGEICPYDPPQPPKPSEPKDNGSNGYKFSGMFALGLILFYIW